MLPHIVLETPTSGLNAAREKLIVALDFPSEDEAMALVDRLEDTCSWFKVGLQLYCAAGNSVVEQLRERGFNVFLDLKLHDIPNTVAAAVRSVSRAGASLLTIHTAGGEAMLRAAAEAADSPGAPFLLGVTVLTSMDTAQLNATGVPDSTTDQAVRLAKLAISCNINGMVCSSKEIHEVRDAAGQDSVIVVPGIRPMGADAGDQRRIATPAEALAQGASMLVVGRPITQAKDPAEAAGSILAEMAG